jgi:hypothetical protein
MPKKILPAAFGLIALYLIATNWKGVSSLITSSTAGAVGVTKAFQGRN